MKKLSVLVFACLAAACGGKVDKDQVVVDTSNDKIVGCWMAKKGDKIPPQGMLVRRTIMLVENGEWSDPLGRLGLTREECGALSR